MNIVKICLSQKSMSKVLVSTCYKQCHVSCLTDFSNAVESDISCSAILSVMILHTALYRDCSTSAGTLGVKHNSISSIRLASLPGLHTVFHYGYWWAWYIHTFGLVTVYRYIVAYFGVTMLRR